MADLQGYLARIGFRGTPQVDLQTLGEIHRRHLLAIPYENLDVQLGRPVGLDIDGIYHKLVDQRRGGWCYEMNGLLAWALETIGFSITRLAAGVMRAHRGDEVLGNHLALWVRLPDEPEPVLADVGFGDGALEPVIIREGPFRQRGFEFSLERLADAWWRFHNHPAGGAASFDFRLVEADGVLLARQCRFLQTSADSPFTQVAVVQRHTPTGLLVLRGRLLSEIAPGSVSRRELVDIDDMAAVLSERFALPVVEPGILWRRVEQQHAAWLERLQQGAPDPQSAPGSVAPS